MSKLAFALKDSKTHMAEVWRLCESCPVKADDRGRLASSLFYISMSHCDAVLLLVKRHNFATSVALLRPLFETTFRGMWVSVCASEDEISSCIKTDEWESPWSLINKVEERLGYPKLLSKLWSNLRKRFHSYTHGGTQNAFRHISADGFIEPKVTNEEKFELVRIVGVFSVAICAQMIELSGSEDFVSELDKVSRAMSVWAL